MRYVEEQIERAAAEGYFDNAEGKGQPLDLKGYFETPVELRLGYSILKSASFVPEPIEK